jgi:hypothetical protein
LFSLSPLQIRKSQFRIFRTAPARSGLKTQDVLRLADLTLYIVFPLPRDRPLTTGMAVWLFRDRGTLPESCHSGKVGSRRNGHPVI